MRHIALLVIDVQQGFDDPIWGVRNNLNAETNITLLLSRWRQLKWPVIHIQHCSIEEDSPLRPDVTGNAFKECALPIEDEVVITKTVNSAFIGTDLKSHLEQQLIQSLVIVGLTTDHCVSTTTRMAGNYGFDVTLISDATATFNRKGHDGIEYTAEQIHAIHLASLHGEFCRVVSTDSLLNQLN